MLLPVVRLETELDGQACLFFVQGFDTRCNLCFVLSGRIILDVASVIDSIATL